MWPQIVMIIMITVSLTIALVQHGKLRTNFNFWITAIDTAILVGVLFAGGFFK